MNIHFQIQLHGQGLYVATNYSMQKLNELEYDVRVHWLHEVDIVKSLNIPGLPTPLASCPLVQSNNYGSSLLLQNITILASYWQI